MRLFPIFHYCISTALIPTSTLVILRRSKFNNINLLHKILIVTFADNDL